jgi:hypothetical protein
MSKRRKSAAPKSAALRPATEDVEGLETTAPIVFPTAIAGKDLLGRPLSPFDRDVLGMYLKTKELVVRTDIPPCASRNLKKSLACLYQVLNDGGVVFEHLYDLGV